jgi:hypothetical protein
VAARSRLGVFKSGKKNIAVFAVLAVALAGGAGFAMSKSGGPATSPVPVPAAAPKLPDPTPTPYSNPDQVEETTPVATRSAKARRSRRAPWPPVRVAAVLLARRPARSSRRTVTRTIR